jgi:signal transduction histidine kinase
MQVLAEDYPVDDPKREIIEEMLSQLRRLDNTVKDLLSFARPASPEPIPCNPNDLAERALFFIRQQARNSQVAIVTDYGANLPQVNVDCQQIQQVVLNIALNAVQAMHEEGTLTVKTSAISHQPSGVSGGSAPPAEYDCVEVAVSDTGKGIPPDDHKKIFQPFFTTKHRGTGLGLPICQRIVEQHGGFIYIESELGKGTTVTVRLPAEDSQS